MTLLDPTRRIEIDRPTTGDLVFVRLPLAGRSETWIDEFRPLARSKDLFADVRESPEGTCVTVTAPADASRDEAAELLDELLRLIDEAQTRADARRSASAPTEQYIRDWWESRTQSSQGNAAPD